jgi:hypothetical protein
MKSKYLGVTAILIATVSVLMAVLFFTLVKYQPEMKPPVNKKVDRTLSARETSRRNVLEKYIDLLPALLEPLAPVEADFAALFPHKPIKLTSKSKKHQPKLNMVFKSDEIAYALIDKKLYRVGDKLTNGARLERIDEKSVLVSESGKWRRLKISCSGSSSGVSISGPSSADSCS